MSNESYTTPHQTMITIQRQNAHPLRSSHGDDDDDDDGGDGDGDGAVWSLDARALVSVLPRTCVGPCVARDAPVQP